MKKLLVGIGLLAGCVSMIGCQQLDKQEECDHTPTRQEEYDQITESYQYKLDTISKQIDEYMKNKDINILIGLRSDLGVVKTVSGGRYEISGACSAISNYHSNYFHMCDGFPGLRNVPAEEERLRFKVDSLWQVACGVSSTPSSVGGDSDVGAVVGGIIAAEVCAPILPF